MTKVLVVDDEPLLQDIYKKGLEKRGFTVCQASDGEEGIRKAREEKPDIILLDLMMPKMDGLAALRQLKEGEETSKIPVIVLTNFGQEEYIKNALDSGADDFILKFRITPEELGQRIKKILG